MWRAHVNTVINFMILQNIGKFLSTWATGDYSWRTQLNRGSKLAGLPVEVQWGLLTWWLVNNDLQKICRENLATKSEICPIFLKIYSLSRQVNLWTHILLAHTIEWPSVVWVQACMAWSHTRIPALEPQTQPVIIRQRHHNRTCRVIRSGGKHNPHFPMATALWPAC